MNARARLAVFLLLGVSCVFALLFYRQLLVNKDVDRSRFEVPKLRVLTYASFASRSGPGPELIAAFEQDCNCKVEVTTVNEAGLLFERLKLSTGPSGIDVVIGFDQLMLENARENFSWHELEVEDLTWAEAVEDLASPQFIPVDWSPLTFIYREDGRFVPKAINDLVRPELKGQLALQDPRSSSPGLQFYNWIKHLKEDQTVEFLTAMKPNVHSVSPSWSFAYGLFRKKQVRFVFSHLTSLAFHWGEENDRKYQALNFKEGHPQQVEFAAIPVSCRECDLAADFVQFLLQPESQQIIMHKNYMFPALSGVEKDSIFESLPKLKPLRVEGGKDLNDWDRVF